TCEGTVIKSIVRVAVKILEPGSMEPEEFLSESKVMKKLHHKHLIQLIGVCTLEEPLYIITKFMSNGTLLEYIRERKDTESPLEFQVQVDIAAQVASGMAFIEINRYIHRDLAAKNILVGENNKVKIAKSGLSILSSDVSTPATQFKFPIRWAAPEVLSNSKFSIKSDVWAFGILMYELLTHGDIPYPDMKIEQILPRVKGGYLHPKPSGCEDYLYDIISDTWKKNPDHRPTFETLHWQLDDYFTSDGGSIGLMYTGV
ncbi:unnamed protein product, partial [Meganyctiphanes norvegica]